MHASIPYVPSRVTPSLPRRPSRRRLLAVLGILAVAAALTSVTSTVAYLALPAPTGVHAVGRTTTVLVDRARPAVWSEPGGHREVPTTVWYPAVWGTGDAASYLSDFDAVRDGLVASGELDGLTVAGIGAVRTTARIGATPAETELLPVVVLSPGNATNVGFYAALAEDLASHGYLVIGVDHPGQVTAVRSTDGSVIPYRAPAAAAGGDVTIARMIDERRDDIAFVLGRLRAGETALAGLAGRIDPQRIAVVGHSNGGLAAAAVCRADGSVTACVNIDGQGAGGPFGADVADTPPDQPFLFLTKEADLHPVLSERFEAAGEGAYRVVIPGVGHGEFADGPRFGPRLLPVDGRTDRLLALERSVVRAFLDHALLDQPGPVFDDLAPALDVYVDVYPLRGKPPLPVSPVPPES